MGIPDLLTAGLLLAVLVLALVAGVLIGRWLDHKEAKALSEELARMQARAAGSDRLSVLEMAAAFAHRFDEVLTSILARSQLVLHRLGDGQPREWTKMVEESAIEAGDLVRQLQAFVQTRQIPKSDSVMLHELVDDVISSVKPRLPAQILLRVELDPMPPIEGDRSGLRTAVGNVIQNAVDAMPSGGTLSISLHAQGNESTLTVQDTGTGMADEVKRHACEPFFTTSPAAFGLGLTVAHGVVLRHGGQLDIDTRTGQGTLVRLRLPIHGADRVLPLPSPTKERHVEMETKDFVECLVVDDDDSVRDVFHDILVEGGHHVTLASDGAAGLEIFRSRHFDLVLTDLAMPELNGLQLARACKDLRPAVPVLLVTGWGDTVTAADQQEYGIDGVLSKPVAVGDLLNAVAAYRPQPA